jgi:hypothetical protein
MAACCAMPLARRAAGHRDDAAKARLSVPTGDADEFARTPATETDRDRARRDQMTAQ